MLKGGVFSGLCSELLRAGRRVRFRASGSSMAPTLSDGDRVTVAPVCAEDVQVGDVLLYAADRGLTAHRVIRRLPEPAGFQMRGDAAGSPAEQVEPARVLGRVEAVERNGAERPLGRGFGRGLQRLRGIGRRLKRFLALF